jgi:hypothetical protein
MEIAQCGLQRAAGDAAGIRVKRRHRAKDWKGDARSDFVNRLERCVQTFAKEDQSTDQTHHRHDTGAVELDDPFERKLVFRGSNDLQ